MSVAVEVEFASDRMPTPDSWRNSILASGFPLEIHADFDPLTFSGYLPARYNSKHAGFEYFHDRETGGTSRVSLVWSGGATEAISGIIAAACLAWLTGGRLVDTESGESVPASGAIAWARKAESDLRSTAGAEERSHEAALSPRKPWWKIW